MPLKISYNNDEPMVLSQLKKGIEGGFAGIFDIYVNDSYSRF
jgi:hypothetical protein